MTTLSLSPLQRWTRYYLFGWHCILFILPLLLLQHILPSTAVTPLLPLTASAVLSRYTDRRVSGILGTAIGLLWAVYADGGWMRVIVTGLLGLLGKRRMWQEIAAIAAATLILVGISWQMVTTPLCVLPIAAYERLIFRQRGARTYCNVDYAP